MMAMAALLALAGLSGCATARGSAELDKARSAYDRAVTGPAADLAPAEMVVAARALNMAERASAADPTDRRSRELAYIAARYAELAIARAGLIQARVEKAAAERDLARARSEPPSGDQRR